MCEAECGARRGRSERELSTLAPPRSAPRLRSDRWNSSPGFGLQALVYPLGGDGKRDIGKIPRSSSQLAPRSAYPLGGSPRPIHS